MTALLSFIFESYCLSCRAMYPELDAGRTPPAE
ncbi:hypothetical protein BRAD285_3444 [Bradyrhizobium sp. ORS 285]|nr:hypothetical protein BRAD285_3444 [Bradyrhizobium sp. ORS 285]